MSYAKIPLQKLLGFSPVEVLFICLTYGLKAEFRARHFTQAGVSSQQLEEAKQSLMKKGLLNAAGAQLPGLKATYQKLKGTLPPSLLDGFLNSLNPKENFLAFQAAVEPGYHTPGEVPAGAAAPGAARAFESRILPGREIEIILPNLERHQGRFAIADLSDIIASHNERTFANSPGYPLTADGHNINDRNYASDPNAQQAVLSYAENLEPSRLVTTSRTPSGTPIVSVDGFVVSGNNRTMSLKLAAESYPDNYTEYLKFLAEEIDSFQIKNRHAQGNISNHYYSFLELCKDAQISKPVLIRVDYDLGELTTTQLSKYNKDTKKSERPLDKALKLSQMLKESPRCKEVINAVVGQYETLSDFYGNLTDQRRLVGTLKDCNILTEQEVGNYYSESGFNSAGKDLIELLLSSLVLNHDALLATEMTGVKRLRSLIITCLPVLVKNAALPEGSLIEDLGRALVLEKAIHASSLGFKDYLQQLSVFDTPPTVRVMTINRLLDQGRNVFKKAIEGYNASVMENQGPSLFGAKPTLEEIFALHIAKKVPETPQISTFAHKDEPLPSAPGADAPGALGTAPELPTESDLRNGEVLTLPYGQDQWLLGYGAGKFYARSERNNEVYAFRAYEHFVRFFTPEKHAEMVSARIGVPSAAPSSAAAQFSETFPVLSNVVVREVQDENGKTYGYLYAGHEGSVESIRITAERLSSEMFARFPDASNIQSRIGATDANGQAAYVISPNFEHIDPIGTLPADATMGDPQAIAELYTPQDADLVDGNWFKRHQEKILGERYQTTGRFGEVTKYRGTLQDLDKIDLAGVELPRSVSVDSPVVSVIETPSATDQLTAKKLSSVKKALKKSSDNIAKKVLHQVRETTESEEPKAPEILSFADVFRQNNPEISQDELEAFIWWKSDIGQPLSQQWQEMSQLGKSKHYQETLERWVNEGILCYFDGSLIPAFLYYAENLWDRKRQLENDRERFVREYGQTAYDNQAKRLQEHYKRVYDSRLLLDDSDVDKRLKILPTSEFAKNFTISTLADEQPFRIKPIGTAKGYGEPDFFGNEKVSDYKRELYQELSLQQAFQYWLVKNRNQIQYKKTTTYFDIITVYLNGRPKPKDTEEAAWQQIKAKAKAEGDRLFGEFLAGELLTSDKVKIETVWNSKYNGYVKINYNKVPIAFPVAKTYRNEPTEIRAEKREAAAFVFTEGSGCIAYDVGFGKTWSAIFTVAQFLSAGYCKRPFFVLPNQVYKQFMAEMKGLLPYVPINDLYNLSADYLNEVIGPGGKVEPVAEGSVTLLTYEGFERIGFNENTNSELIFELYDILNQGREKDEKSEKKKASFQERLESIVGRGLKGSMVNIEDLGLDFMCADEAHAMKKVFTSVKGNQVETEDGQRTGKRERTQYQISSGEPSTIALKGFMIAQYIQRNNHYRNVMLLTATPFTNSPLEVFSMLALIAYKKLKDSDINNLTTFFDNYINTSTELVINAKLQPERRQVVLGYNNIKALQTLVFRFINFKNADTKDSNGKKVHIVRPNKWVLPLKHKLVDGVKILLDPDEQIRTALPMTALQDSIMGKIRAYAEGLTDYDTLCSTTAPNTFTASGNLDEDDEIDTTEGVEVDESSLNDDEKAGVRTLRAMNLARNLALSPYLYKCNGLSSSPTYLEYIETSPKLLYVMECIRSVKEWHEQDGSPMSGQVIYMDRGVEYFGLIKEYLVKKLGFREHEVGIIKSGMKGGKNAKEAVKNQFLGIFYDEKTRSFRDIPDEERMKIVIGSGTIKEGINLQKHSTVLYDCFLDWNPTDMTQIEGRIWRQGNNYSDVRIVLPMMENSMDIFIFQKLEEKTSRLNQIWSTDNESNVLNLEELNPGELKYELISDPNTLARLEANDKASKLDDEVYSLENQVQRVTAVKENVRKVATYEPYAREWVAKFRDTTPDESLENILRKANDILKTQTDKNGVRLTGHQLYLASHKQYWQDPLSGAIRLQKRDEEKFLKPLGLTLENLDSYSQSLVDQINELKSQREGFFLEGMLSERAAQIAQEKAEKAAGRKTLSERVEQFAQLNHLLGNRRTQVPAPVPLVSVAQAPSCPPVDASGVRRIDAAAIAQLNTCLAEMPQTKALHTLSPDLYTDERIKLHEKIIGHMLEGKQCQTQQTPICVLTGGLPGAGKSTILKKYSKWLTSDKIFKIDADEVRAQLPEYQGWNAAVTHLETKDIVNELLNRVGHPCTFDMIYDGTMNTARNYIPLIEKINSLGYKTFIIYVQVPYEVSVQRAMERYQRSGRYVPLDVINDAWGKGLDAFHTIKQLVAGYVLVDGLTQEIIERGGEEIPADRGYGIHALPQTPEGDESEALAQRSRQKEKKRKRIAIRRRKLELEYSYQQAA